MILSAELQNIIYNKYPRDSKRYFYAVIKNEFLNNVIEYCNKSIYYDYL